MSHERHEHPLENDQHRVLDVAAHWWQTAKDILRKKGTKASAGIAGVALALTGCNTPVKAEPSYNPSPSGISSETSTATTPSSETSPSPNLNPRELTPALEALAAKADKVSLKELKKWPADQQVNSRLAFLKDLSSNGNYPSVAFNDNTTGFPKTSTSGKSGFESITNFNTFDKPIGENATDEEIYRSHIHNVSILAGASAKDVTYDSTKLDMETAERNKALAYMPGCQSYKDFSVKKMYDEQKGKLVPLDYEQLLLTTVGPEEGQKPSKNYTIEIGGKTYPARDIHLSFVTEDNEQNGSADLQMVYVSRTDEDGKPDGSEAGNWSECKLTRIN